MKYVHILWNSISARCIHDKNSLEQIMKIAHQLRFFYWFLASKSKPNTEWGFSVLSYKY